MVKTALSQMSFHDRGFNSLDGFDSQSSRVPVLSYDRGNDGLCLYIRIIKMCLARSNMRAHGQRIQPPGVAQRNAHTIAARGSFGIDTHGHRSDFCESVVFTIVL